jgi:peptidyl-prolyl cis-trans isomerase C
MKKIVLFLLIFIIFYGCGSKQKQKNIVALVNNYEITLEEFEEEFKNSIYGQQDTPEVRQQFLDNLINRKLILQDAQRKGLDKDKEFLKMIERFWEQSLLKLALDKKSKEIAGSTLVSDKKIREVYDRMISEGKTDKSYEQMYHQIKWEITKLKETQLMNKWLEDLRKEAKIKINYDLIKKKK